MSLVQDLLYLLVCYIVGAIPTGLILGLQIARVDVRTQGSKNIGTTNVWRVLGWKLGLTTLLIDVGKAYLIVRYGAVLFPDGGTLPEVMLLGGLAVLVGNFFNVFLGFKGGKGVATSLGVFLALAPIPIGLAFLTFAVTLAISRYVSLSSILASLVLPAATLWVYGFGGLFVLTALIGLVVILKHRSNIKRLLDGTENRVGRKQSG
jgi:glycerol-3-phosphate acyltransferase PlsY